MTDDSTAALIRQWLNELNSRDTFELGVYRLLAWSQTAGSEDKWHADRLRAWSAILGDLSVELRKAANR